METREVIHGKMLRREAISIILHDINIYFPGKRALKTDSLIEEQRCGQLAPRQSCSRVNYSPPPAEFPTHPPPPPPPQGRTARRSREDRAFSERQNQAKVKVQPWLKAAKANSGYQDSADGPKFQNNQPRFCQRNGRTASRLLNIVQLRLSGGPAWRRQPAAAFPASQLPAC